MRNNTTRIPHWKRLESWFLVFALITIVVTGIAGFTDWQDLAAIREKTRVDRDALEQSITILSAVREAEVDQRSFLWTGDDADLEAYRTAIVQIPGQLKKLRESAPNQAAAIDKLHQLIDQKLKQLEDGADLRREAGTTAAMTTLSSDEDRKNTEDIRTISRKITGIEFSEHSAGSQKITDLMNRMIPFSVVGNVVPCVLLVLAAVSMRAGTKRRKTLMVELRENERTSLILQEKAEVAESQVRNILESITDGFVSLDHDWTITYCNSEAARIFGQPKSEVTGKNLWEQFPELIGSAIQVEYKTALLKKEARNFEVFVESRSQFWEQSAYPSAEGLTVYLRDVSERKRLEERARNTHKLESLGVLAGGIAHDFNNLLTIILGNASLMLDELPPDNPTRSLAENVVTASERASELTQQMLAYSGRGRFVVERLDLGVQVKRITALLKTAISSGVELVLNLQSNGALIEADRGQLEQLIMNLVLNAAESIKSKKGHISVSTRAVALDEHYLEDNLAIDAIKPGRFVVLEVKDTGSGMDEVTMERMFDPFSRRNSRAAVWVWPQCWES